MATTLRGFSFTTVGMALALACSECPAPAAVRSLELLPNKVILCSSESRQTIVAQWREDGQHLQQAAGDALKIQSIDEKVVRIVDGVAVPVANGAATLTA